MTPGQREDAKTAIRTLLGGACDGFTQDSEGSLAEFIALLEELTEEFRADLREAN